MIEGFDLRGVRVAPQGALLSLCSKESVLLFAPADCQLFHRISLDFEPKLEFFYSSSSIFAVVNRELPAELLIINAKTTELVGKLEFTEEVRSAELTAYFVIVKFERQVLIFSIGDLEIVDKIYIELNSAYQFSKERNTIAVVAPGCYGTVIELRRYNVDKSKIDISLIQTGISISTFIFHESMIICGSIDGYMNTYDIGDDGDIKMEFRQQDGQLTQILWSNEQIISVTSQNIVSVYGQHEKEPVRQIQLPCQCMLYTHEGRVRVINSGGQFGALDLEKGEIAHEKELVLL